MYIHLGSDVVVSHSDVIAILDLDTTSVSKNTRKFLDNMQKNGRVIDVSSNDLPKSYVLCGKKEKCNIYISPISAQTLYKRAMGNFKIDFD